MNTPSTSRAYVGAQNDALYIVVGEPPASTNDYPRHDADRTAIAKVYDAETGRRLAACWNLLLPFTTEQIEAGAADILLLAAQRDALLVACTNALDIISVDRRSLVDCSALRDIRTDNPVANGLVQVEEDTWITTEDAEALRDYDRAIELLEAAIAKATGSPT